MSETQTPQIRFVGEQQVIAHLPVRAAADSLRQALLQGLDPAADSPRTRADLQHGQFLMMPSEFGDVAGIKILTVAPGNADAGLPTIQGNYLLHDAATLTPIAVIDGTALTAVRTPAVSALGIDLLAAPDARDVVVFGTGPQALHHVRAAAAVRQLGRVGVVGRSADKVQEMVRTLGKEGYDVRAATAEEVSDAQIIMCCTAASQPLFRGEAVREDAVVVAMGSHTPEARETDDALAARARVYVEDRETAMREAGDVIQAVADGALRLEDVSDLRELVTAPRTDGGGPALFKTVGMGWQDLIVAKALFENLPG